MNIKKIGSMVAAATVLSLAAAGLSATAANAATGTPPQFYLLDGGDGHMLPDSTVMAWNSQVLASPGVNVSDLDTPFPGSADATGATNFISPIGQETTMANWSATGNQALVIGGTDILSPNLTLASFIKGNWATVKQGGDYSLGFAWTKNNGLNLADAGVKFVHIHVQPGGAGNWTFDPQAVVSTDTAPAVTTQPADATVHSGAAASFTAAASGSPAPTVQWQSKVGTGAWTDISGATNATLSLSGVKAAQSGTQYQAVFTNTKGSATSNAATLTVDTPDQPSGTDPNMVTITDPAKGAASLVVPTGVGNAGKSLQAWAWSDATKLGAPVTTDATTGDVTVDISSLPAGQHTIAFTSPGDASLSVVAWGTFTKLATAGDPASANVDVKATVTASDLWSLNAANTQVDFGNVQRGVTKTASLGKVTVVDDRNTLKGWDLDAAWTKFTKGTDEIAATALTLTPKAFAGYTPIAGVTVDGQGTKIAHSSAVSTGTTGALFDADLAFTAPATAQAGEYHSTLTITLTSK